MRRLLVLLVAAALLGFGAAASCRRIPPDHIGVRVLNVGGDTTKGLVPQDFDAGFYRSIWLWERWDTLPRAVQKVSFTDLTDQRGSLDGPSISAKTKDGDSVSVEASILVRIAEGKGHVVYVDSGPGENFIRLARDLSAPEIANTVATMRTEDIYDKKRRREAVTSLYERLRTKLLTQKSLELVSVELTEVRFDAKYEEQLRKKKVNSENKRLEVSLQEKATQGGERDKIIQTTDNLVKEIQNRLKNKQSDISVNTLKRKQEIESEALKKAETRKAEALQAKLGMAAEGSQKLKEAEAYAADLQRRALEPDQGNYVAYVTAQNFPVKSVTMPSVGVDWLSPIRLAAQAGAFLQAAGATPSSPPKN